MIKNISILVTIVSVLFLSNFSMAGGAGGGGGAAPCVIGASSNQGAVTGGNDCFSAISLGALSTACPCDGATVTPSTWSSSNIGATPGNVPYPSILDCGGAGGDQASPAADVWYQVEITGNNLIIDITGGINNPNVAMWGGDCATGIVPLGCATGTGGTLSATLSNVSPGDVVYLQISGGNTSDQGNFNLTLYNNNLCDLCVTSSSLTVNPPPVNGYYQPGQTVT